MRPDDFDFLAKLLRERSGLVLTADKTYLLDSRLTPVARKWSMKGLEELVAALRLRGDARLVGDVVEAMTTNESLFFRDIKPFEQFKKIVLPALLERRAAKRHIRIWSAACSSGQEPYSLAMVLREEGARLSGWRIEIVATDIAPQMIERCRQGIYSQFEVQRGLPIQLLVKYFKQMGDRWQIDPTLRANIDFRVFNLLDNAAGLGSFDVVFCRNVLIYFDQPTKAKVLEQIHGRMPEDGFLYLGGAETVLGITNRFEPMPGERGIYRVVKAAGRAA